MAIKISGTTVIDDSRNVTDVENVGDANTVYYGSGANLTGIQAGSSTFTASGAISNGDTVIINSNGTVSAIAASGSSDPSAGSAVVFKDGKGFNPMSVYDPNTKKVIVAYIDSNSSGDGKAIVGTVSGDTISFGSVITFETGGFIEELVITYDTNSQRVVVFYQESGGNGGRARVGTVSGTSITFGSKQTIDQNVQDIAACFDAAADRVVFAYMDKGDSDKGKIYTAETTSSRTLTNHQITEFRNRKAAHNALVYNPEVERCMVMWRDEGYSSRGQANVFEIDSNGSVTLLGGNQWHPTDTASGYPAAVYDPDSDKIVISYKGTSSYGYGRVGTMTTNSISWGTAVAYNSSLTYYNEIVYDSSERKVLTAYYTNHSIAPGKMVSGTVSGTSITFSSIATWESENKASNNFSDYPFGLSYDSEASKVVLTYYHGASSSSASGNETRAKVISTDGRTTNLTANNYIGIAAEAISSGSSGSITIAGGTNSSQSGLTTGRVFVNRTGDLETTSIGKPSVVGGTAISSSSVIVKNTIV